MTRIPSVVERNLYAYKNDTDTCYELVLFLQRSLFKLPGWKEAVLFTLSAAQWWIVMYDNIVVFPYV